jgi:hypothetical protein
MGGVGCFSYDSESSFVGFHKRNRRGVGLNTHEKRYMPSESPPVAGCEIQLYMFAALLIKAMICML